MEPKRKAALEHIEDIYWATKRLEAFGSIDDAERVRRSGMIDLRDYLRSNWNGLRNYAAETRRGRKISSALVESAMSHLVNQRMGKRQPMRWSAPAPICYCRFAALYSTTGWILYSASGTRNSASSTP